MLSCQAAFFSNRLPFVCADGQSPLP
jgi:hypothetical protein